MIIASCRICSRINTVSTNSKIRVNKMAESADQVRPILS
jgi:hypothetical protein